MDMHLCQGKMKTFNFAGKAKNCHDMAANVGSAHCKKKLTACHSTENSSDSSCEKECCSQQSLVSQLDTDAVAVVVDYKVDKTLYFAAAFALSIHSAGNEYALNSLSIVYIPPPLWRDIPILIQSFLL